MPPDTTLGAAASSAVADRSGLDCVRLVALYFDKTVDAAWLWQTYATDQGTFDRQSVVRGLQHLGFQVMLKKSTRRGLARAASRTPPAGWTPSWAPRSTATCWACPCPPP